MLLVTLAAYRFDMLSKNLEGGNICLCNQTESSLPAGNKHAIHLQPISLLVPQYSYWSNITHPARSSCLHFVWLDLPLLTLIWLLELLIPLPASCWICFLIAFFFFLCFFSLWSTFLQRLFLCVLLGSTLTQAGILSLCSTNVISTCRAGKRVYLKFQIIKEYVTESAVNTKLRLKERNIWGWLWQRVF